MQWFNCDLSTTLTVELHKTPDPGGPALIVKSNKKDHTEKFHEYFTARD